MAKTLREDLERKRAGYDRERTWHRFLIDAYTGGGGFQGRIKTDDTAFDCEHALETTESYLDRYPREDDKKFASRIAVSYYLNHVEPLTDLKLSFMLSKPFTVEGLPSEIEEWKRDVDGSGLAWDHARMRVAFRAAIVGYCPTIIDRPEVPEGTRTKAQAAAMGVDKPHLTILWPSNLTEWERERSTISWIKVRTDHVERTGFRDEERKYARIDVWDDARCSRFEIPDGGGEPVDLGDVTHGLRRIPITVCKHRESESDPVKGRPMHGAVSLANRRLFNLSSELDENLRSHAFPILVLAEGISPDDDEDKGDDERTVGSDNGLILDKDATQKHYYLGPPGNITESIERRIEEIIREIYRMARTEHVRPAGVADATGIARRYAFAATNAAIAAFAQLVALWEQETYVTVGLSMGLAQETLDKIRVVAPLEFDIEDLDSAIRQAMDATSMEIGATARQAIVSRLVKLLLPNATPEMLRKIDAELKELEAKRAKQAEDDEAFGKSGKQPPKPGEKVPPEDEPDDEEDDVDE